MKKFLFIAFGIVFLAVISWGGAGYFLYLRNPSAPEIPEMASTPESSTVPIGTKVPFHFTFSVPWGAQFGDLTVNSGTHCVSAGNADISTEKAALFTCRKRISVYLTAISPGKNTDSSVEFSVNIGGKTFPARVKLPDITVSEPGVTEVKTLQLAGKEEIKAQGTLLRNSVIIITALLAAALLLTILYVWKFKKRETPASEWQRARDELSRLRADITDERITPEKGFIRLTDLVRSYLERRFGLPATRHTTQEFIEDISRNGNFLPEAQKPFLRNFLAAADQVKFALARAEKESIIRAADDAGALYDATRPQAEEEK